MADDLQAEEPEEQQEADDIARLRNKAKKADELQAQNQQLAREMAFIRAGVDTTKGPGKLAFEKFEGEADPEAVTAFVQETAEAYGFSIAEGESKPEAQEEEQVDPAVQQQRQTEAQMAEAMRTGPAVDPSQMPDRNPYEVGMENYLAERARGTANEEAAGAWISEVFQAAAQGDKRVLYEP